jgi:hypothetical protein
VRDGTDPDLGGARERVGQLALEAELVHDPAGLLAARGAAAVEDEGLLHADEDAAAPEDLLVLAGGLPVAGLRGAVGPGPRRVLAILVAEEVPLLLPHLGPACRNQNANFQLGHGSQEAPVQEEKGRKKARAWP